MTGRGEPEMPDADRDGAETVRVSALLDEIATDHLTLLDVLRRLEENQRALAVQLDDLRQDSEFGVRALRTELGGALTFRALKDLATELIAPLTAMEAMAARGDFTDPNVVGRHLHSLTVTLRGVLGRMGVERFAVAVGHELYDPTRHHCVGIVDDADSPFPGVPPGTVVRVVAEGYALAQRPLVHPEVEIQAGPHASQEN
jgi:molecular chaperone GrpE (heat shock protein)